MYCRTDCAFFNREDSYLVIDIIANVNIFAAGIVKNFYIKGPAAYLNNVAGIYFMLLVIMWNYGLGRNNFDKYIDLKQ